MNEKIKQLEQYLAQQPEDAFLIHAMALEYRKAGDFINSQQYFEKNLQLHPEYIGTYHAYGQLLEMHQQPNQAIEIYTKGLEVAQAQKDFKTYNELQSAIDLVDED